MTVGQHAHFSPMRQRDEVATCWVSEQQENTVAAKRLTRVQVPLASGMKVAAHFQLVELLGQGGFAQVWEAEAKDGRRVALKFMPCRSDLSAAREVRAIQAICQLRHPNLIGVDQICSDIGYIVVVMELADGSLLDLLHKYQQTIGAPIRPDLVCLYLAQAARAIDFLNTHQHQVQGQRLGFQHCDIKSSNILLLGDEVKISDFGLSTATGSAIKIHRKVGTVHYAAPEVFQGRLSDWTDQYSLAVTYVHLRTGTLPFGDAPGSFHHSFVRQAPDLHMLPLAEQPIISRALSVIPQARWPSCVEMMNRLAATLK